jgi:hypothetical protein
MQRETNALLDRPREVEGSIERLRRLYDAWRRCRPGTN